MFSFSILNLSSSPRFFRFTLGSVARSRPKKPSSRRKAHSKMTLGSESTFNSIIIITAAYRNAHEKRKVHSTTRDYGKLSPSTTDIGRLGVECSVLHSRLIWFRAFDMPSKKTKAPVWVIKHKTWVSLAHSVTRQHILSVCALLYFFSSTSSRELISSQITTNNDRLYTTRQLTTACSTTARVRLKLERSTRGEKNTTGKTARMKRVCGGATSRREYAEPWASWSEQTNSWRKVIHSSTQHNGNPLSLASHGYERRKNPCKKTVKKKTQKKTQFLLCSPFVTATLKPAREQPREEREKLNFTLYRMLRVDQRAHVV